MDQIKENNFSTSPEPISLAVTEKIILQMKNNSICRINNHDKGTGFFAKIPYKSRLLNVLITTNQVINQNDIQGNKIISLHLNNGKIAIKLHNNRLIYTNEKTDITIIEIKENDHDLNIKYLELEDEIMDFFKLNKKESQNCLINLNSFYLNESIYCLNYPKDKDIYISYGKLLHINSSDIFYNCNTKEGASGLPILLINNQKLIGIHCDSSKQNKYNKGELLIYSIIEFSKIKNNLLIINKEGKNIFINYIISELDIKEDEQNTKIINCLEGISEIFINNKLIPFSCFHKFNKKGKYTILYIFKNNITKTNYMFDECSSLKNIDFSNFNTNKVTDMSYMFRECSSLEEINLSNFNTNNVTNMEGMFYYCSSLKNLNLSNFNNNNVKSMCCMFNGCSSLKNINLSNFNTNNVHNMFEMFDGCSSLKEINLSNFNTNKVTDMGSMFFYCSSLKSLNLSNFNTNNVTSMCEMFWGCESLTNINLSNFNTNNVTNMAGMFYDCSSLRKENIITNNKNILIEFKNKNL